VEKQEKTSVKMKEIKRPEYVPPKIITYSEKEILEHIGPAQACSPQPCSITP
jgi:hypothetical protein